MNRQDKLINELEQLNRRIATGQATATDRRRKRQITDELKALRAGPNATEWRVPRGIETR